MKTIKLGDNYFVFQNEEQFKAVQRLLQVSSAESLSAINRILILYREGMCEAYDEEQDE